MNIRLRLFTAAIAAALAASTAWAASQEETKKQKGPRKGEQAARQQSEKESGAAKQVSLSGEVLRLKRVDLADRNGDHTVALIRSRGGQRRVVDLGRTEKLDKLNIEEGDKISVQGQPAMIGDRPVVLARRVRTGEKSAQLDPERSQLRGGQQARACGGRKQPISGPGEILRLKQVAIRGTDRKHTVVALKTEAGKKRIVDLGPSENLQRLDLQEGDSIAVQGQVVNVDEHQLLLADKLRTEDRVVTIDRPERRTRTAARRARGPQDRGQQAEVGEGRWRERPGARPGRWVLIAADYDRDGRFDAYGTIYYADLAAAREQTRKRIDQGERQARRPEGPQQRTTQERQLERFSGEIADLQMKSFRGREGKYLVAEVRSEEGEKRTVNLGGRADLRGLDLRKGDQVAVLARPAMIDGQRGLVAELVRAGGETADVRGSTSRTLRR